MTIRPGDLSHHAIMKSMKAPIKIGKPPAARAVEVGPYGPFEHASLGTMRVTCAAAKTYMCYKECCDAIFCVSFLSLGGTIAKS